MLCFDIGSNVGNWALANLTNYDKIVSIEASPNTFQRLTNNSSNHKNKIVPLNYAVCNNNGNDIIFYEAESDTISTLNKNWLIDPTSRFYNYPYREIVCKTITIDDLIKQYGSPDLIKIDVEGGEYECVASLNTKVNLLCFEWATETNDISFKCLDHLFKLGFSQYYLQFQDNYTFRPQSSEYYDILTIKNKLNKTTPKVDWGMIWCK